MDAKCQVFLDGCRALEPHPCVGCPAFNHAEKCATVRDVDCRVKRENVCKNY